MSTETCCRSVIRDGCDEPCDKPARFIAFDPEGEFFYSGGGWYPACHRHRALSLPALSHNRPDLSAIGGGAIATAGLVSNA